MGCYREVGGAYDTVKLDRINELLKVMAVLPAIYMTEESLAEALWRTLFMFVEDSDLYPVPNTFGDTSHHWFTDVLARALMANLYRSTTLENSGSLSSDERTKLAILKAPREKPSSQQ